MTSKFAPTKEQQEVIDYVDPVLVVLGGAGTGKTTTAAAAARAHLERRDAAVQSVPVAKGASAPVTDRVLFLSFSRASVSRITERNRPILSHYRRRVEVTTFHALAWRLIVRFGSLIDLPDPHLTTYAESRLFQIEGSLRYQDLVPKALELVSIPVVGRHVQTRWSLIVCDEYQDTDDSQQSLVDAIRGEARMLLLGDPNQCIYANLPNAVGVSPERLERALTLPGSRRIELPDASHRDPTGVIPAAAAAIRRRRFNSEAITTAIETERLQIFWDRDPSHEAGAVATTIEALRAQGMSVAVFSHHNDALAALSDQLRQLGVDHEITGLSESLTSALDAQMTLAKFAAGMCTWDDALGAIAIFVTSSVRGNRVPTLAYQILGQQLGAETLSQRLNDLRQRLDGASIPQAIEDAAGAHAAIGLPNKSSAWARAAQLLAPMYLKANESQHTAEHSDEATIARLDRLVAARRTALLTEETTETETSIQLMNLHQTKGREADATVVVLRADDFFGYERDEPFEEGSRLLYVVFSRARKRIVVLIFGTQLKALVAPFTQLAKPIN